MIAFVFGALFGSALGVWVAAIVSAGGDKID